MTVPATADLDRIGVKRALALKRRLWWRHLWQRFRMPANRGYRPDPRAFRDPESGTEITLDLNTPVPGAITDMNGNTIEGPITMRDLLWMAERPDGTNPMLASIFAHAQAASARPRSTVATDVGYVSVESFTITGATPGRPGTLSMGASIEWNPAIHDIGEWKAFKGPSGATVNINLLQIVRGSIDGRSEGPFVLSRVMDMVGEASFVAALFSQLDRREQ
jgi:hypothetical protein